MNQMAFTPEEVKKGLYLKLLNYLIEFNTESEHRVDIRIWNDGYCTVVDWDFNIEGEQFEWVDTEHVVLKEVIFPDNHIEYMHDDEEHDALVEFLKDNPEFE